MPFALIPDGFTIQKVTAAQERAVKSKRRQDDLIALINNPQTIAVLGTIIGGTLVATQVDDIIDSLKESGVQVSDDVIQATKDKLGSGFSLASRATSPLLPVDAALGIIRTAGIIDSDTETRIRELIPGI